MPDELEAEEDEQLSLVTTSGPKWVAQTLAAHPTAFAGNSAQATISSAVSVPVQSSGTDRQRIAHEGAAENLQYAREMMLEKA